MAGFVRSDTDTTPLGIMMMAQRRLLLRTRMKMTMKPRDMIGQLNTQILTRVNLVTNECW